MCWNENHLATQHFLGFQWSKPKISFFQRLAYLYVNKYKTNFNLFWEFYSFQNILYFHFMIFSENVPFVLKHEPKNDQDLLAMVSIPDAKGSIGRILLSSSSASSTSFSTSKKDMFLSLYKDIWVIKRSSWLEKATIL